MIDANGNAVDAETQAVLEELMALGDAWWSVGIVSASDPRLEPAVRKIISARYDRVTDAILASPSVMARVLRDAGYTPETLPPLASPVAAG